MIAKRFTMAIFRDVPAAAARGGILLLLLCQALAVAAAGVQKDATDRIGRPGSHEFNELLKEKLDAFPTDGKVHGAGEMKSEKQCGPLPLAALLSSPKGLAALAYTDFCSRCWLSHCGASDSYRHSVTTGRRCLSIWFSTYPMEFCYIWGNWAILT